VKKGKKGKKGGEIHKKELRYYIFELKQKTEDFE